ncbi:hypothetical protein, partial [Sinorhizobium medicae]|uniref:hypothetical protein n=1 Tax=Sinorhizobium medicae TaxID=110321 RepID=UPI0027DB3D37
SSLPPKEGSIRCPDLPLAMPEGNTHLGPNRGEHRSQAAPGWAVVVREAPPRPLVPIRCTLNAAI